MLFSSHLSKVDQEIVKVIQERMRACQQREGPSYHQNCAQEIQQFNEVTKNFQSRCKYCGVLDMVGKEVEPKNFLAV